MLTIPSYTWLLISLLDRTFKTINLQLYRERKRESIQVLLNDERQELEFGRHNQEIPRIHKFSFIWLIMNWYTCKLFGQTHSKL